ncbi:WD40 repeat domain-containing serine/threonine-protein kinase [Spirillospora albida]|uniref:WD40 repeat domain-containing serine/threonine-protein kinase n=1 Tax=Spirillospora albida TaxID=58123 RepID=UPI00068FC286|nr:WD40 repeat domain-containing serine/threonine-protein kinase [Spirillospora albida]
MSSPLLDGDPRQLGGYWLAARLGAGGQGVVYEGYDARGVRVAVKALHAGAVTPAYRDALRKEVATLQRVASFCTARIITADLDHFPPYIVSEYVPGPDLQNRVDHNGKYGPGELHRLAIGIATALASIHRAGVVHRDLKPANVLLGPDGPRVIDFGIAKTDDMSRSATGRLKGTPRWMAPELFRGERATPAVDVWAWGAIVLYAASGAPPFDGDTLPALMHQITTRTPDTDVLGEPLRGLVEAALDRDPAERPAFQDILTGLLGGEAGEVLEAGTRAAAESARPSMTLPPSLADLAEQVYGRLDPHAQQAVPRILLRMVVAGPHADDVLRPVPLGDLADGETDQHTVRRVLHDLGGAGLLRRVDGDSAAIAVPALLRAWPRLRDWVEAERDGLNGHHALADAARRWNAGGRRPADLLQGTSLDEAVGWASTGRRQLTLNLAERAFLEASVEQTRHRARTRTIVTGALAALLLVATIAGSAAGVQSWNLARANATVSEQRDAAVGLQLAAQAVQLRRTDPTLARRLAVAAASLAGDTPDTHNALLALSSQWEQDIWAPPGTDGSWNDVPAASGGPNVYWKRDQRTVIVADAAARRVTRTISVPGAPLTGMDVTLDGGRLFTLQTDGTMTFWDLAKGTARPLPYKHQAGAGLWISPTGAKLVKTLNGQITVLETATGRELFRAKGKTSVWGPALPPDERHLVMPLEDGKDRMRLAWWDLTTGEELKGRHNRPGRHPFAGARQLRDTTFSPDGRFLATRVGDVIVVLNARTREIRTTLKVPKGAGDDPGLDFSRDGGHIATGMTMWSTDPGIDEAPYLSYTPDAMCSGTRFSRDGTSLRCVGHDDRIRSIDVSGFTRRLRFSPFSAQSRISRDGTTLAVRTTDGRVQIWDTATRTRRADPGIGHPVGREMVLSPDGRLLGLPGPDGKVEIWDLRARRMRGTVDTGPPAATRPPPSFSPDGRALAVLVSGAPTVLRFWDTATGRPLGEARAPQQTFADDGTRIVWSEDGRRVVSVPVLGVVGFPSGKTLVAPGALGTAAVSRTVQALSPQGVLATVEGVTDQRSLTFWDAATLKPKGAPVRLPEGKTPITAISPDGRLAATADSKGRIDVWDVRTRRHLGLALTGHTTNHDTVIQSLAFSPDGTRVHSVGQDDASLITHIVAPRLLEQELCKRSGRLTRQEWDQHVRRIGGIGYRKTC